MQQKNDVSKIAQKSFRHIFNIGFQNPSLPDGFFPSKSQSTVNYFKKAIG